MNVSGAAVPAPRFARFRFWLLAVVLLLFVPVGVLAKQAMATLFIALAILLLGAVWLERRRIAWPEKPVLIAFAAVVGLSLLGAWFGGQGLHLAGMLQKLGLLALLLVCVSAVREIRAGLFREPLVLCLAAGIFLGAVIFAIELTFDAPLYRFFSGKGWEVDIAPSRFNRGSTALVLLSWPAAAGLWLGGRRVAALLLVLAGLAAASIGESASAALSAMVAVLILPLAVLNGRIASRLVLLLTVPLMVAAPWILGNLLVWIPDYVTVFPPSFADRLEIWHSASLAAVEQPLIGLGLGAMRSLEVPEAVKATYSFFKHGTIHPHNAAIQIWLELGIGGILAALFLLWRLVLASDPLPRPARAAAISALCCGLVIAAVSYGLWQETWLGIIGLTVLAFGVLCGNESSSD
ncbi:O-antigen ligase family protein [uncultured Nisaea sp.]|uniref:O-antigen ligase family protein n=1 Tax=uncultured Nisaea sp. TaxID=538215 RepID=UPI0030ECE310|tara:strand:+ start:120 stop:1340 length:1221 start_codon:yes stop_codon:yes gene_type:complete